VYVSGGVASLRIPPAFDFVASISVSDVTTVCTDLYGGKTAKVSNFTDRLALVCLSAANALVGTDTRAGFEDIKILVG
jgi:hypothetical protein